MLELIATKPFDQVLNTEIAQKAGVSYPTFYRRFSGKKGLLNHIATGEVRQLMKLSSDALAAGDGTSVRQMCDYVASRRVLWQTLLNGGAQATMRDEFIRLARERATSTHRANPWIPLDLSVPFVTAGMFEIFAWWMRQDAGYPVEDVVTIIDALIVQTTYRHRDIKLTGTT